MSSRKILILGIALPTLGAVMYSFKYSGKPCGGENASLKENQCPRYYECVLENAQPNSKSVCRFLPNGLRLWEQPPQRNEVVVIPPVKDPTVEYDLQTKKARKLTFANTRFGFELLKTLAYDEQQKEKNILISPTSMGLAFSILYNGAAGSTKDQMTNVLQLPGFSLYELNESAKILIDRINSPTAGITSNISNSVWIRDNIKLNSEFINNSQASYNAYVASLDFSDPQASKTMNTWVFGNTAGKIQDVVPENIGPETVAYIINTAYFNGIWKYRFTSDKIELRDFYKQDGTISNNVPSMKMERDNFLYFENETFQAIKLPYGEDQKYSMLVLLPKEINVDTMLGNFDISNWQTWLDSFKDQKGILYLPKFKMDYGGTMVSALKSIGMTLPFSPGEADLSKLSLDGLSKELYVSDVIHKTYLDVNEEGTEAAAATSIELSFTAIAETKPEDLPFLMDVNKPFFLAIVNNETQANLFVGIVRVL